MPKTRKSRSRASSSTRGAIPLDPNYTGADPQFGNISNLPRGVKRQTALLSLQDLNTDAKTWFRLTFKFPECVGIAETLNQQAKKGECIPTLSMNVKILVPVVKNFAIDIIKGPPDYVVNADIANHTASEATRRFFLLENKPTKLAFILTGDDQLTTKVPDIDDEDKTVTTTHAEVIASISNAIYAKYWDNPDAPGQISEFVKKIGKDDTAKDFGGFETVPWDNKAPIAPQEATYYQNWAPALAANTGSQQVSDPSMVVIDNIQDKGHTLTSDHVNLFIWNNYPAKSPTVGGKIAGRYWTIRTTLDYTTKEVSLSSLLIWRRQLKEFLPKQIQWRMLETAVAAKANKWEIALSRGSIKESGVGDDPSSKTDFPDIEDEKKDEED